MSQSSDTRYDLTSQLLSFRAAYLQAISRAWSDKGFKKTIITKVDEKPENGDPLPPDAKNILAVDEFTDLIKPSGMLKRWMLKVYLIERAKGEPFGEYQPFNPLGHNGWLSRGHEIFVLKIPKKPKIESDNSKGQLSTALMHYYQLFPTLFGDYITLLGGEQSFSGESDNMSNIEQLGASLSVQDDLNAVLWNDVQHARLHNVRNELGIGGEPQFLAFAAVFIQIVSRCWADEAYRKFILDYNIAPTGNPKAHFRDDNIHFENPWAFNIQFQEDNDVEYKVNEDGSGHWTRLPKNTLILGYPEPPQESVQPVALARYNATGPAFPFTCSCC